ncbi:signal peptidase II [Nocardiopsis sp. NPDC058789]|uniref:Lipoprotein signal peptidase n=1 Tax=Nocardiopsis eucommiae TaxID=2831970 RepID=A0A975L7Q7_9ACTN|nr:signal peptidase II [Nocardiopsis eucommiae]
MTTTDNTVARPRRYVLLLVVALTAIVVDFLTKEWVLAAFSPGERLDVVGEFVQFTLVYNTGAAFSLGTGYTWVFTAIATVVVLAIAWIGWRVRSLWWGATLGLMMGGAAGNLVDRYFRGETPGTGAVVDFISVGTFPVFNVADSCVVVGACLVVALTFKGLNLDGTRAEDEGAGPDEGAAKDNDDNDEGKGA